MHVHLMIKHNLFILPWFALLVIKDGGIFIAMVFYYSTQGVQRRMVFVVNLFLFLAHLSRRLIGELIVYPWSRRPSYVVRPSSVVVHNAQTSSSPKSLGRSKPNFMWSLLG